VGVPARGRRRLDLRRALPNACFLGFSGTPIDKKDRSTLETFGPYIDQYTIEQAVADEATVPIFYESRLAELHIIGQTLDQIFTALRKGEKVRVKYGQCWVFAGLTSAAQRSIADVVPPSGEYMVLAVRGASGC
jgi:type I restriction enzyme R subunit